MTSTSSLFDSMYSSYGTSYSGSRYGNNSSYLDRKPSSSTTSSYSSGVSPYSSSYSSSYNSSRIPTSSSSTYVPALSSSVYDKYYNYLDDLSSGRRYNSSSSSSSSSSRLPSTSSSSSSSSSTYRSSRYPDTSTSTKVGLGLGPSYDKYGKELSNYDRWRIRQGGGGDSASSSPSSTLSSLDLERSRKRFGALDDVDRGRDHSPTVAATPTTSTTIMKESDFYRYGGRGGSMLPSIPSSSSSSLSSSIRSPTSSSSASSSLLLRGLPSGVSDKEIILQMKRTTRSFLTFCPWKKLSGYTVKDVRGDGGCYYRCLSLYFTGVEDNYMKYRREVLAYIRDHLDNYSSMIRSELGQSKSTNDYFSRKMRADRQDWAETTEIIATCCVYNINVHVLALVPGRRATWEWLHFDPSIGTGKPSCASRDVHLYNQGSVHFMLCTPL